ncbi:MAG: hypothetical protein L0207_02465 [Chlamydiae bacterium]|nr:hypothetical protein [Chlamydiota bacterium]
MALKLNLFALSFFCISVSFLYGQEEVEIKSPEEIQQELDQAQRDFEIAQKMFIPWYTGPLITGSANNVPAGRYNIQPYLFFNETYARYNGNRKSVDIPNIFTFNPLVVLQRGLTSWLDITLVPQAFFRWSQHKSTQQFGDTAVTFGLQALTQTPYAPSIRFTIGENFPSGKYKRLNPNKNGIDGVGAGVYSTVFGINLNKIIWQFPLHPISLRFSGTYQVPNNRAPVRGFNAYGGGFGTKGRVKAGQVLNLDVGVEVSLTQRWVLATDFVYTYSWKSTFSGNPGISPLGLLAANGAPSSDQFSIAPAIEYNVSEKGGFIGGVWFTLTGRNSSNFIALVLSYTYLF